MFQSFIGLRPYGADGTLLVPAITGPVPGGQAVTAVVAVAADGTVVASSAPSLYRPGRPAASELPAPVTSAIAAGPGRAVSKAPPASTPRGSVLWTLVCPTGRAGTGEPGPAACVYVQAPWSPSPGFVNPVRAWGELGQLGETGPLLTRQPGSALAAERQRATGDARAAERARIAREIHDAISQHLFGLRMIAAGMRRADPGNEQARAIERISEQALRDMQALLVELRPAGPDVLLLDLYMPGLDGG